MSPIQALVLGLVQGLSEFLPISSSGHLVVLQHLWQMSPDARLALAAVLHVGTAAAAIVYFGRRIRALAFGLLARQPELRARSREFAVWVLLSSVPAAVAALAWARPLADFGTDARVVGPLMLVTGLLLFATKWSRGRSVRFDWRTALLVGVAQAAALLPGVSRSGATIAAALLVGVERRESFEYSFLLSIPLVLGAAVHQLLRVDLSLATPAGLGLGIAASFGAGLVALTVLRRTVAARQLHLFAWYCWSAGLVALGLGLVAG